ncbi:hypothetical protein [Pedobacter caeni]|uniref:Uncharacterized protein n=1 Tax=Pedobacter caeni TaxID=288992 RepID=A0A1M4T9P5_9SPHI|nr:hypothetical protein [Pedobacter caeni]SHE41068.1 hypothetical protein SAMN04488522_101125 [Pedobacter caeni]
MEEHTNMKFSHLIRNEPLSPADEQLVNHWLKTHRKTMWMWACCFLPLLLFAAIGYFFLSDVIWRSALAVASSLAPFFIWKFVSALLRKAKIESALRKGIKKVTTGLLQNLEAGINFPLCTFLLYTVNNNTIKVWAPGGYAIERNGFLNQAQLTLEVLPLSVKNNRILTICYADIPQASTITESVSATDKKPHMTIWSKKGLYILLCILGLWGIILALTPKPEVSFAISLIMIVPLVYLAGLNEVFNHRIQKCNQKISVTGIITEVILSKIDDDDARTKIYWYRVGNEMFDGGTAYNSFRLKDKVCFSYLANKNGEQEMIIDVVKID